MHIIVFPFNKIYIIRWQKAFAVDSSIATRHTNVGAQGKFETIKFKFI